MAAEAVPPYDGDFDANQRGDAADIEQPAEPGGPPDTPIFDGDEVADAAHTELPPPASLPPPERAALLTALLFTAEDIPDATRLAEFFGVEVKELGALAEEAGGALRALGLDVLPAAGGYKLVTASHWDGYIGQFHRQLRKARLSKSALEILAVIAYEQPVSRVKVDELRQTNSESAVRTLLDRRLIKVSGREDGPGRPFLYKTTETFLEVFGLSTLADLPPKPASFKADVEAQEEQLQQEEGTGALHVRGEVDE
jgi:segregation and condensation protein B